MTECRRSRAGNARHLVASVSVLTVLTTVIGTVLVAGAPATSAATTSAARPAPGIVVRSLAVPAVDGAGRSSAEAKPSDSATGGDLLAAHLLAPSTSGFRMLAMTWRSGTSVPGMVVRARTHSATGWTGWQRLSVDPDEGPSAREDGSIREGTEPLWVDHADGLEVRVLSPSGRAPVDLRAATIDPGANPRGTETALRSPTSARVSSVAATQQGISPTTFPRMPRIVSRKEWGADPSLRDNCWKPIYGKTAKMVFVHHTAGSNSYSESDAPAIVRSIYAYHTQAEHWCDIGYNFLVDKYGNVYQGRAGGNRRPVRGAHAGDYNVNTVGISLMGNFQQVAPTTAMKRSLIRLIGWRLGTSYRPARGWTHINGLRLRRISGHRDAMQTACPGQVAYDWLPTLRRKVAYYLSDYHSPMRARWKAMGGADSLLGQPFVGEHFIHGGRTAVFQHGRMYYSPRSGAHWLNKAILVRFARVGAVRSELGYPKTDVVRQPTPGVRRASFVHGRIYWSKPTGAREVWGKIGRRYRRMGADTSRLGLPVTGMRAVTDGYRVTFQHGSISWDTSNNTTKVVYK